MLNAEHFKISLRYLVVLFLNTISISSLAKPPKVLNLTMSRQSGSCHSSIALYEGARIIMQLPHAVRVAIPSKDHLVDIFVSEQLVVLHPSAQHRSHTHKIPETVSLTLELSTGATFICSFELFKRNELLDPTSLIELIKVHAADELRQAESAAIDLLQGALTRDLSNTPKTDISEASTKSLTSLNKMIISWRKRLKRQIIENMLMADDFKVSSITPLRAQEHLIYITIERAITAQKELSFRAILHNRSQAPFELSRVYFFERASAQPSEVWPRRLQDVMSDTLNDQSKVVLISGQSPLKLAFTAPITALTGSPLYFESRDGRTIAVQLSQLTELSHP